MWIFDLITPDLSAKILEAFFILCGNGLLLFWGSFYIAKAIEKHRAKESLRVSFIGELVKTMDKVSKLLFQVEHAIDTMAKELAVLDLKRMNDEGTEEERSHSAWFKLITAQMDILKVKKDAALMVIEESRFWLGKEYYDIFIEHYKLLEAYERLMAVKKFLEAKELWKKIDASRLYALTFLSEKRGTVAGGDAWVRY